MPADWVMTAKVDQYEAEIRYRDDFGVWDCSLYDHKKNEYIRQETAVGGFDWFMEDMDKWFDEYVETHKTKNAPITTECERSFLHDAQWHINMDLSNSNTEVWENLFVSGKIIIERYRGITFVQGRPDSLKWALHVLERFDASCEEVE